MQQKIAQHPTTRSSPTITDTCFERRGVRHWSEKCHSSSVPGWKCKSTRPPRSYCSCRGLCLPTVSPQQRTRYNSDTIHISAAFFPVWFSSPSLFLFFLLVFYTKHLGVKLAHVIRNRKSQEDGQRGMQTGRQVRRQTDRQADR